MVTNETMLELHRKRLKEAGQDPKDAVWSQICVCGYEPPLGHTYSVIVEELAKEGKEIVPELGVFLEHIKEGLRSDCKFGLDDYITPEEKSSMMYSRHIVRYMREKGLSDETCSRVIDNVLGTHAWQYEKENIDKFVPLNPQPIKRF